MVNLRTGPKRSDRSSSRGETNSETKTKSALESSWFSRRNLSSFDGMSTSNLAEFIRPAIFSLDFAAIIPTIASGGKKQKPYRSALTVTEVISYGYTMRKQVSNSSGSRGIRCLADGDEETLLIVASPAWRCLSRVGMFKAVDLFLKTGEDRKLTIINPRAHGHINLYSYPMSENTFDSCMGQ